MSKRYGRNQKRRDRETIRQLQEQVADLTKRTRLAEYRLSDARSVAFKEFTEQAGLIKHAMTIASHELARGLGKELHPHAIKLLEASRERQPIIDFTLESPLSRTETILRGEIPRLRYNVILW